MQRIQIRKITTTALLSAICIILYFYVKFPLPFFPPFLEINFSMLPAILCGYIVGPIYGIIVVVIRFLTKLGITHTAGVGEIADLLIGSATVITASSIYYFKRNKKGAVISLICGGIIWVGAATLFNWLLLVPTYVKLYFNGNLDAFISMLEVIPSVSKDNYMWKYLLFAVVPFNTLLASIVCVITFIVYKPLSKLFKNQEQAKKKPQDNMAVSCKKIDDKTVEIVIKIKKG